MQKIVFLEWYTFVVVDRFPYPAIASASELCEYLSFSEKFFSYRNRLTLYYKGKPHLPFAHMAYTNKIVLTVVISKGTFQPLICLFVRLR